jgi:hypothetical protein
MRLFNQIHNSEFICSNKLLSHLQCLRTQSERISQTKMEITMRKKILTLLVAPLLAALSAQAALASEHHRTQTKHRTVAIERFRNSNAFAAPGNIVAPDNSAAPSYLSTEDEAR